MPENVSIFMNTVRVARNNETLAKDLRNADFSAMTFQCSLHDDFGAYKWSENAFKDPEYGFSRGGEIREHQKQQKSSFLNYLEIRSEN